jgi:hypothetical protein
MLYRIFWADNDDMDETRELGFVSAANDEEAFSQIPEGLDAATFAGEDRNEDAFFTVEAMDSVDRLADILVYNLQPHGLFCGADWDKMARAMLESVK